MVRKKTIEFDGQVLHAGLLGFIHPKTEEYLEFSYPLPENFTRFARRIKKTIVDN